MSVTTLAPTGPATTDFAGIELTTSPLVMRPRGTSFELAALAVAELTRRGGVAVDVGTGSGAIAIAVATWAPEATVWATDVSAPAVRLATANARWARVDDRVHVRRGDLLEPVAGPADVIVANLPYLPSSERALHPDLWDEPAHAVFSPGDGLGIVRRLVAAAAGRLAEGGLLALQLPGRVVAARRPGLDELQRRLAAPTRAAA
jgi:release factor glutamine methyltransferase